MSALSRRNFLSLTGSAATAVMSGRFTHSAQAAMGPNDKFDLVIKGGDVLDPSQSLRGKRDIGIRWGMIEAIEAEIPAARASKTIDAAGKLVTPGLIDLHCHVYPYGSAIGIPADELVQFQGTTTVVSAGDAGVNNLAALRRYIVAQSRARIYAFVHIANNGLSAFPVAELYNIDHAQVEACAMALAENPDFLIGVKVRMSENVIFKHGLESLKRAIQACEMCGWPAKMMVHIGGVDGLRGAGGWNLHFDRLDHSPANADVAFSPQRLAGIEHVAALDHEVELVGRTHRRLRGICDAPRHHSSCGRSGEAEKIAA